MKTWQVLLVYLLAIIAMIAVTMSISSCASFRPIWLDELPAECNMSLNVVKAYYESKDKSGMQSAIDLCMKCLVKEKCQKEVFGVDKNGNPNKVNYIDADLYRDYEQCRSSLK